MSYGIEIKNPLGYVQLDDSHSQFQILEITTITPVFCSWIDDLGTVPLYCYGLTVTTNDLYFVRLDNTAGYIGSQIGGNWVYPSANLLLLATANTPLTIIKCKKSTTLPNVTTGYHLNIYNTSSELVFSSAYNNVSIVSANMYNNSAFYYGSTNSALLPTPNLLANYKRCLLLNYLPCVTAMVVDSEHGAPPDILFNVMGKYNSSSAIHFKSIPNRNVVPNFYTNFPGTFTAIIGDLIW
jgi:hypothetical protein